MAGIADLFRIIGDNDIGGNAGFAGRAFKRLGSRTQVA